MIILDTTVVSETSRPTPDTNVLAFLDSLDRTTTYITAVTASELLRDVELLPSGKRKQALEQDVSNILENHFSGRILSFDFDAARKQAVSSADAQRRGKKVPLADSLIAGIALMHGAIVATRDVMPFEAMGVNTINPWEPMSQ